MGVDRYLIGFLDIASVFYRVCRCCLGILSVVYRFIGVLSVIGSVSVFNRVHRYCIVFLSGFSILHRCAIGVSLVSQYFIGVLSDTSDSCQHFIRCIST